MVFKRYYQLVLVLVGNSRHSIEECIRGKMNCFFPTSSRLMRVCDDSERNESRRDQTAAGVAKESNPTPQEDANRHGCCSLPTNKHGLFSPWLSIEISLSWQMGTLQGEPLAFRWSVLHVRFLAAFGTLDSSLAHPETAHECFLPERPRFQQPPTAVLFQSSWLPLILWLLT